MRDAGYDGLADPDEVDVVLEPKLDEIVGSPEERAAFPPGEGPEYDTAALKALQQEEVAMVAADSDGRL